MQRLINLRLLVAWLLAIGFASGAYAIDDRYYQLADSADHAIAAENWSRAEHTILEALRLEPSAPGNVMLMSNLSIVQMQQGRTDDAVRTISDAIAAAPTSLTLLNNRARIYSALSRDDEAIDDYTTMLSIDSTSVKALFGRGIALLAKNELELAERDLHRLESISPNSRETHLAFSTLCSLRGEYEKAEAHFTALIEREPTDEYYLGRAVSRMMMGNYSEASADLTEGMKLNPQNPDLYAQRAYLSKLTYRMTEYDIDMRLARKLGYTGD